MTQKFHRRDGTHSLVTTTTNKGIWHALILCTLVAGNEEEQSNCSDKRQPASSHQKPNRITAS